MKIVITNKGRLDENEYLKAALDVERPVYEVIRVIDGVALFLEDHYERLTKSILLQGLNFKISYPEFKRHIDELVAICNQTEGNVKFACAVRETEADWALSFIPHSYPATGEYENGVAAGLLFAERTNPNAKVVQPDIRTKANQMMAEKNFYEVLLVNREGMITEGSRSNVFFCKSDELYTAPASMVLEGITRRKVIQCIENLGFKLVEQAVSYTGLRSFDAAFISGTSPKILPVRLIDDTLFDVSNNALRKLMYVYDQMIEEYIRHQKLNLNN